MLFTPEEITNIRNQVQQSVNEAILAGVPCMYPESFTLSKVVDGFTVTVTFPFDHVVIDQDNP